jgi:hypothetical protein
LSIPDWKQKLRDLLCELYELVGGDCADLGATPLVQIQTVDAAYAIKTPPQGDWATANDLLDQIETLKAEPENPLSSSTNQELATMITNVRVKVTA